LTISEHNFNNFNKLVYIIHIYVISYIIKYIYNAYTKFFMVLTKKKLSIITQHCMKNLQMLLYVL